MDSKKETNETLEYLRLLQNGITAEAVADFMNSEFDSLSRSSTVSRIGLNTSSVDLIRSDVPIVSEGELSKNFFIDDSTLYDGLADKVVKFYELVKKQSPEIGDADAYFTAVVNAVQFQQIQYFNNMIVGNRGKRADMLGDFIDSEYDQPTFSIAELKSVAMCMERATVSHNMLKLLGIDSRIEIGELETSEGDKEGHAWIVIIGPDGVSRIYDPLNCHVVKDENGAAVGVKPLVEKFDGSRENAHAVQNIYSKNQQVISEHPLTYIFATEEKLAFAKDYLGR